MESGGAASACGELHPNRYAGRPTRHFHRGEATGKTRGDTSMLISGLMKALLTISFLSLLFPLALFGEKELPPFAGELSQPQMVDILAFSNSNQVRYLGFDWLNTYCFGRLLGCVVSDQPATAEFSYGEIVFKLGDWFFYATCSGNGPHAEYKWLRPCWQPNARVQVSSKENRRTLIVGQPGEKWRAGMGHTYTVISAFNAQTQDVWGDGTAEAWRQVITAIEITAELKTMSVDEQISWSGKIMGLRGAGLLNADNLEKVLAEMHSPKPVPATAESR
jgi:hypothetical protein